MAKTRNIQIDELFTIERGKGKYTRGYAESNPGNIPVFSASLGAPMAYSKEADFSGPLLTFTTNGYGGKVQLIHGDFTVNGDRAVLLPRTEVDLPDLRYLARVIEQAIRPLAVGRRADAGRNEYTKIAPKIVKSVTIPLIVDDNGNLDFESMEDFGETIERSTVLQENLRTRLDQLRNANVVLDAGKSIEIELGDEKRFSRAIGKRVLRSELSPTGEVPVYSANARAPMGFADRSLTGYEFDAPSLIWGIDGVFDWNLIPADTPFVPTDHCGRIEVLDGELDPEYLLYALRATKDSHGFDRVFRANLANIAQLTVPVPVDAVGKPDIKKQRDLAKQYRKLDAVSNEILTRLSVITDVVVTPQ